MSDPSTVWADESYSLPDAYVHLTSHSTRVQPTDWTRWLTVQNWMVANASQVKCTVSVTYIAGADDDNFTLSIWE